MDRERVAGLSIGFIIGAALGLACAILYAPRSGRETRAVLMEKVGEARHKAGEVVEEARERTKKVMDDARGKT